MQKEFNMEQLNLIVKAIDAYQATVIVIDADGKIVFVNKSLCQKLGLERNKLIGIPVEQYRKMTASDVVYAAKSLETGKQFVNLYQLTDEINLEVMSYPIYDSEGKILGAIGSGYDDELVKRLDGIVKDAESKKAGVSKAMSYISEKIVNDTFVYTDKKMQRLFNSAKLLAPTDSTVLISGESGTGKEIVANYIHKNSNRSENMFMPVNCGAIPENLIEAEFFGYERGAFTGADKNGKAGLFELADNGTIFLDEIGELPLLMQAKLLRVIETGEIKRIGGSKRIFANVRIIAATNKNLEEMVKHNEFREDLFYRLSVIPLNIPPLRERPADVEPLMVFFAQRFNKKYKTHLVIDSQIMERYKNYSWPGNVRELKNEVERLVIFSLGGGDISSINKNIGNTSSVEESRIDADIKSGLKLKEIVEKYERDLLKKCLEKNNGNVRKTATELGIDRSSFYRKLKGEQ